MYQQNIARLVNAVVEDDSNATHYHNIYVWDYNKRGRCVLIRGSDIVKKEDYPPIPGHLLVDLQLDHDAYELMETIRSEVMLYNLCKVYIYNRDIYVELYNADDWPEMCERAKHTRASRMSM